MLRIILFFLFATLSFSSLQAQVYDNTRGLTVCDSFPWVMVPYNMFIQNTFDAGVNQLEVTIVFQSINDPNLIISGRGRFVIDTNTLPQGLSLNQNDNGNLLLSVPPPPPNGSGNWPGGQPPFPLIVYGYLQNVEGTAVDPPIPVTLQVRQLFYEDTTE